MSEADHILAFYGDEQCLEKYKAMSVAISSSFPSADDQVAHVMRVLLDREGESAEVLALEQVREFMRLCYHHATGAETFAELDARCGAAPREAPDGE